MNAHEKIMPLSNWCLHPDELAAQFTIAFSKNNNWALGSQKYFDFLHELQQQIYADIASGKLKIRRWPSRLILPPLAIITNTTLLDLQDFCDWAIDAGLQCPQNAHDLAVKFKLPTEGLSPSSILSESDKSKGVPPKLPNAEKADSASNAPGTVRRDLLVPVIEAAQKECKDPFDTPAVWAFLSQMAQAKKRPLVGVTEDGLKWFDANDAPKFLTLRNLGDRLKRMNKKRGNAL